MRNANKSQHGPDVIYTQQFHAASANFLNYMERDNAVDMKADYNLNYELGPNVQEDSEAVRAGYIGYMDRNPATTLEDDVSQDTLKDLIHQLPEKQQQQAMRLQEQLHLLITQRRKLLKQQGELDQGQSYRLTQQEIRFNQELNSVTHAGQVRLPTFDQDDFNITRDQEQQLRQRLARGEKNGTIMWQGVVSFDNDFLKRIGVRNATNGHVDQRRLKAAIQKAMPDMLIQENLQQDSFWFGDIHLNTHHVHVHLAIAQERNTRLLTKDGQPKGTFSKRSFDIFKREVHRQLANNRDQEIEIEDRINLLRKNLVSTMKTDLQQPNTELEQQLERLVLVLPDYSDKRKWRASNHRKDFAEAHQIGDDIINELLEHDLKGLNQQLTQTLNRQLAQRQSAYGQIDVASKNRQMQRVHDRLLNEVFRTVSNYDQKGAKSKLTQQVENDDFFTNSQRIDELKALIKDQQPGNQSASLKLELGLRKNHLRLMNLEQQRFSIEARLARLQSSEGDHELQQRLTNRLNQELRYVNLQKKPRFKRTKAESQELAALKRSQTPIGVLQVSNASPELVSARSGSLKQEQQWLRDFPDDPSLKAYYSTDDLASVRQQLVRDQELLQTKSQVFLNNQRIDQPGTTIQKKQQLRAENNRLFQQIKHVDYLNRHGPQARKESDEKKVDQQKTLDVREQMPFNQAQHAIFKGLAGELKGSCRKQLQAMNDHLDSGDDIDRDDRREALAIETGFER